MQARFIATVKVLLYGESARPGSGAWCYAESLREMGHDVVVSADSEGLENYPSNVGLRAARKLLRAPLPWHRRTHVARLVATAQRERPEIVIVLKGLALGPEDVDTLRATGAWVVNINHDDFFSLNRNNWSPLQRRAIPQYDFVFTTREVNVEEIRSLNPNVEFFEFAYYPRIHRPLSITDHERHQWAVDVVFVGTWERERSRLLEHLVNEVPAQYAIWGSQWDRLHARSPLRPFLRGREVVMDDMAKALGSAKLALGFLRKENRDDYTQRTFEIPACGGVFVGERTNRHLGYYKEGIEASFFEPSEPASLARVVRELLGDDFRRESLRSAGLAAVSRQKHTYAHRLAHLLELHQLTRH